MEETQELLTVLEWAEERLANTTRIAAVTTGADREGWIEDGGYWQAIVVQLREHASLTRERAELLAALKAAAQFVAVDVSRGPAVNGWENTVNMIKAAIAKAEGR